MFYRKDKEKNASQWRNTGELQIILKVEIWKHAGGEWRKRRNVDGKNQTYRKAVRQHQWVPTYANLSQ